MKPGPVRLESIDVARGLAALSVAIYHQGYGHGLVHLTGLQAFSLLDLPGSRLAVPLFFVISGFCIHLGGLARQNDPRFTRGFFIQRFFRIYPPWVSAVAASALVAWLNGRPATGGQLLTHLTLTNGFFDDYRLNPVLWSVSVESLLYLLYPAWLAFRRRHGLAAGFALGLAVSAGSSAVTCYFQPVPSGPAMWFFLNVWCGWLAGAVLAENLQSAGRALLRLPVWWIGGGLAVVLHVACIRAGVYRGAAAYVQLPVTIMLSVWPLSVLLAAGEKLAARPRAAWLAWGWRRLAHIGLFSYSLYLLHVPLQALSFLILPHLGSAWAKGLLLAGWLGVVLLGSWLHYRWVEAPAIQWGRKILAGDRPAVMSPPRRSPDMTASPRPPEALGERAVITLALGPAIYRAMAVNLARSIRRWHAPGTMAITLVTDDPAPLPADLSDVQLLLLQPAELGVGFQTKLHLDRLAPARQTLFIDADCLVYGPLDPLFARLAGRAVATVGGAMSAGEWFGDVGALCRRLGVAAIPKFNGGLYYLEPGETASGVYRQARELAGRYDELGLVRLRGHPNDELIMASAMALAGLAALPDDGTVMSDPQACPGPLHVNVLHGTRLLVNPPPPSPLHQTWYPFGVVQPVIVHFLGHHVRGSIYRAEALRLRLAAAGWPAALADVAATLAIDLPGRAIEWTKRRLRPILHRLAGPRRIQPAVR